MISKIGDFGLSPAVRPPACKGRLPAHTGPSLIIIGLSVYTLSGH